MNVTRVALVVSILVILAAVLYFSFAQPGAPSPSTSSGATDAFGTPAANVSPTPVTADAFVRGFYAWYLGGLASDQGFALSAGFAASAPSWLSPTFLAALPTLRTSLEADPLLLTQDFQPDWATSMEASVANRSATSTEVRVTLGSGSTADALLVTVAGGPGTWRVDSVGR